MLGWLRDIASLRESLGKLEAEVTGLREQIEARIQELTRTKAETVRESIEQSIVSLEQTKKEAEERLALVNHTVSELESLSSEECVGLFSPYWTSFELFSTAISSTTCRTSCRTDSVQRSFRSFRWLTPLGSCSRCFRSVTLTGGGTQCLQRTRASTWPWRNRSIP